DPVEADRAEPCGHPAAERARAAPARVHARDVARGAVDAVALVVSGEPAEADDLRRILEGAAGRVAAERLEAGRDPGGLGLPAPAGRLLPAPVRHVEDVRGDHQVAVELVAARDDVAGI